MSEEKNTSNDIMTIDALKYSISAMSDECKGSISKMQNTNQGIALISLVLDAARFTVENEFESLKPKLPPPIDSEEPEADQPSH
jgi:hypothetical protein